MPKRKVLILDQEESPWPSFLEEFFNDTLAEVHYFRNAPEASYFLNKNTPDILFIKDDLLSDVLIQKIRAQRQSSANGRIFRLGMATGKKPVRFPCYDAVFQEPLVFQEFQQELVKHLSYPDKLRVLIVDDEPEITKSLVDYLRERSAPSFEIDGALNGKAGLEKILKNPPDILVLDVKMPEMNGIEVYRQIKQRRIELPVMVYFDAVLGDEVIELHKIGNPAIVEKGAKDSTITYMTSLILKMAYFA